MPKTDISTPPDVIGRLYTYYHISRFGSENLFPYSVHWLNKPQERLTAYVENGVYGDRDLEKALASFKADPSNSNVDFNALEFQLVPSEDVGLMRSSIAHKGFITSRASESCFVLVSSPKGLDAFSFRN